MDQNFYFIFRHNIQPGMVVIFIKEKLVFADWIFNGHGADFHSFQKQIQICKTRYKEGRVPRTESMRHQPFSGSVVPGTDQSVLPGT